MENKEPQNLTSPSFIGFFIGLYLVFAPIIRRGIVIPSSLDSPVNGNELIAILFLMWAVGIAVLIGIASWSTESKGFALLHGFSSGLILGSCGVCSYYAFLLVRKFDIVWGS